MTQNISTCNFLSHKRKPVKRDNLGTFQLIFKLYNVGDKINTKFKFQANLTCQLNDNSLWVYSNPPGKSVINETWTPFKSKRSSSRIHEAVSVTTDIQLKRTFKYPTPTWLKIDSQLVPNRQTCWSFIKLISRQ